MKHQVIFNRWVCGVLLFLLVNGLACAESVVECNFNRLSEGQIDGQPGWDVYDKVKDSSAFSVVTELGTTEKAGDKALIIKASEIPIRCVTDQPVRWVRKQTLSVEFDFRVVIPNTKIRNDSPLLVLYIGNAVLNEKARWAVRLDTTVNGDWKLTASLPDEATQTIPADKLMLLTRESSRISDWYHCVVEIEKLSALDSFHSNVKILDKNGQSIAAVRCTNDTKDSVTKEIWNLSRLNAGFSASKEQHGLACIDNFRIMTQP